MQVAIDTSTEYAGLAIVDDGRIIAELNWRCGREHSTQLLPNLERLLGQTGLGLDKADCIIVARGPGSYNGLRVGLSAAKGLTFSLGVPLVSIGTLEAQAFQFAGRGLPVCAVLDAGRGEVAAAIYGREGGRWLELAEPQVSGVGELCSRIASKTLFCGGYVPEIAAELKSRLKQKAVIPEKVEMLRRAGYLAELGLARFREGDFDDPATLQPVYFRGPSITKPKKQQGVN